MFRALRSRDHIRAGLTELFIKEKGCGACRVHGSGSSQALSWRCCRTVWLMSTSPISKGHGTGKCIPHEHPPVWRCLRGRIYRMMKMLKTGRNGCAREWRLFLLRPACCPHVRRRSLMPGDTEAHYGTFTEDSVTDRAGKAVAATISNTVPGIYVETWPSKGAYVSMDHLFDGTYDLVIVPAGAARRHTREPARAKAKGRKNSARSRPVTRSSPPGHPRKNWDFLRYRS